ncbi:MAG TPA: SAM-dependent methyltransferase [Micromonosporaceae bacterium]
MVDYALLVAPSANRVYTAEAPRLTRAELAAFGTVLTRPVTEVADLELGGVRYIGFRVDDPGLDDRDTAYLSNVSTGYALFRREGGDGELLRPVPLRPLARFDDDLITIPKYAGKTNEQFTRLLLNLTVLAGDRAGRMLDTPLTVLDPLCGRGTTLSQALMYGYHAIGIEIDGKDVDAYVAFLRAWLKRKRIKHRADLHPVRRDRRQVARCFEATIAGEQHLAVYHADTVDARQFLRAGIADAVVADLPYGVAHGSRAGGELSRRPLDLLRAAVPVWAELLRPGGALGISWNVHVAARDDAAKILEGSGLVVVDEPGYRDLAHWVDQAITRDILVARKPVR